MKISKILEITPALNEMMKIKNLSATPGFIFSSCLDLVNPVLKNYEVQRMKLLNDLGVPSQAIGNITDIATGKVIEPGVANPSVLVAGTTWTEIVPAGIKFDFVNEENQQQFNDEYSKLIDTETGVDLPTVRIDDLKNIVVPLVQNLAGIEYSPIAVLSRVVIVA